MSKPDSPENFTEKLCRAMIRPVIGILLRSGMPFAKFSAIARSIYVDVASKQFGISGRRANKSRVAMLTGLTRTRVKLELELLARSDDASPPQDSVRPASRVLMGWHSDKRFLDNDGSPRELSVGEGVCFRTLYDDYSGKLVPMTAMLKELINVEAVELTDAGLLRVKARSFTPHQSDPAALERVSAAIHDLGATASFNLFKSRQERARFERFATNQLIPASEADNFRDFLEQEGQEFLERVDDWMTQRECRHDTDTELQRIGVGVYQIAPDKNSDNGT